MSAKPEKKRKLSIDNIKITNGNYQEHASKELTKLLDEVRKSQFVGQMDSVNSYNSAPYKDMAELLPKYNWEEVEFTLSGSYAGFANAIRRCLMSEIEVVCLNLTKEDIETNDDYIIPEMLQKNINLVPIMQNVKALESLYLFVHNKSGRRRVVELADFKGGEKIFAEPIIPIAELLGDKYLKIKKLTLERGTARESAAKFTLLNNVSYEILDCEPYDVFTGTGQSSAVSDPAQFKISFKTKGNISGRDVMAKCCESLLERLNFMLDNVEKYIKYAETKSPDYFNNGKFEVVCYDTILYKFNEFGTTMGGLVTKKIYYLDPNIALCNFSARDGFLAIRIMHPAHNKIMCDAIRECIEDVQMLNLAFDKKNK
jgi:DNA-directed RNA polymerase subunit L